MRKLSESIWSDIQDRSSGETNRKEDDVNLLDREGLYDYLIHHYKSTNHFSNISTSASFNTIDVPIIINGGIYCVYFDFNTNEVYVHYATLYMVNKLLIKVSKNFSLRSNSNEHPQIYIISPKDRSKVTNRFFIDVVDFFIDNIPDSEGRAIKKIMNESIWSDIQDRSAGDVVRKEDDVNLLDGEGLKDYITKHYKLLNTLAIVTCVGGILGVPIIKINTNCCIMYHPEAISYKICIVDDIVDSVDGLLEKLNTHFEIKEHYGEDMNGKYTLYYVSPKDGSDVTNKFFIEVIDFLLDNIPDTPKYKKSIEKIS